MTRWILNAVILLFVAGHLPAADMNYTVGSKLTVVLANGEPCEVKVARRNADLVTVEPRKTKTGCPTAASILDLQTVVQVTREQSHRVLRKIAIPFVIAFGAMFGVDVGFRTGSSVAGWGVFGGSIAAGVVIGESGYRWTVYLNRSSLDPA